MSLINVKGLVIEDPHITIPSFIVEAGDIIHLQGESGVGKSSFLKSLVRLKKISSGSIIYTDKKNISAQEIRSSLLYIPQFTGAESNTVENYVTEVFTVNRIDSDIIEDLEELGIKNIIEKKIDQISGGERQLLALIVAMKLDRKVLVLDESFSAIDPKRISIIIKKLLAWKQDLRAIVYISHQVLDLDKYVSGQYLLKKSQNIVSLSEI